MEINLEYFLAFFVIFLGAYTTRTMALYRGRDTFWWTFASVIVSPLVTVPLLLILGNSARISSDEQPARNQGRKVALYSGVMIAIVLLAGNATHKENEQTVSQLLKELLEERDIHATITDVKIPIAVYFGSKVTGDAFGEKDRHIIHFSFSVIPMEGVGSMIFGGNVYVEISATELTKINLS